MYQFIRKTEKSLLLNNSIHSFPPDGGFTIISEIKIFVYEIGVGVGRSVGDGAEVSIEVGILIGADVGRESRTNKVVAEESYDVEFLFIRIINKLFPLIAEDLVRSVIDDVAMRLFEKLRIGKLFHDVVSDSQLFVTGLNVSP
jgi:hypothetical protein